MKTKLEFLTALIAASVATMALAQAPAATSSSKLASEPGKATAVHTVEASAEVVAIDKGTRTLSLKRPNGEVLEVIAGDEVRNFDRIKIGDMVVARYVASLALELRKTRTVAGEPVVREDLAVAEQGESRGIKGSRTVTLVAEVVGLNPVASTITLKGPKGKVVTLDVQNPDQFKVIKVGDQLDITYTEAVALSLEPVAKAAPGAKNP